jgi:hypothetical protein
MKAQKNVFEKHRDYVAFVDIEEDEIDTIYDFGVRDCHTDDYDDDAPELILLKDTEGSIHVMKGKAYGREFSKHIIYPYDIELENNNYPITVVRDMILIQTFKIVGIIEKKVGLESTSALIQVFEFNYEEADSNPTMQREFEMIYSREDQAVSRFRQEVIIDNLNKLFFLKDYKEQEEKMNVLPIDNNVTNKSEGVFLNNQIAMNIVANNVSVTDKKVTKGMIYTDFLCADNLLVLLHGKVLTCFDLMDKSKKYQHVRLYPDEAAKKTKDFYS